MNEVTVKILSAEEMLRRASARPDAEESHIDQMTAAVQPDWVLLEYRGTEIFHRVDKAGLVLKYFQQPNSDVMCVVMRNNDRTEGRGPVSFHMLFKNYQDAVDYILEQDGIYGTKQGSQNYPGVNIYGGAYCVSGFNGYDILFVQAQ